MPFEKLAFKLPDEIQQRLDQAPSKPSRYQCSVCYKFFEGKPFGFRYYSIFKDIRKETVWNVIKPQPVCSLACHYYLVKRCTVFEPPPEMVATLTCHVFLTRNGKPADFEASYPLVLSTPKQVNANLEFRILSYMGKASFRLSKSPKIEPLDDLKAAIPPSPLKLGDFLRAHPTFAAKFTPPLTVPAPPPITP